MLAVIDGALQKENQQGRESWPLPSARAAILCSRKTPPTPKSLKPSPHQGACDQEALAC